PCKHSRASVRDNQIPYLRTSAIAYAWVVRRKDRNRARNYGVQPVAHNKPARCAQTDGNTASRLTKAAAKCAISNPQMNLVFNHAPPPGSLTLAPQRPLPS